MIEEMPIVLVDLKRVLAEEIGRRGLVDVRADRLGAEERLAEPDEPVVGLDLDPGEVRHALDPEGRDAPDSHRR